MAEESEKTIENIKEINLLSKELEKINKSSKILFAVIIFYIIINSFSPTTSSHITLQVLMLSLIFSLYSYINKLSNTVIDILYRISKE